MSSRNRLPEHIYCDQAATSFPKPETVKQAVLNTMESSSASPGRSAHQMALAAARTVFEARETAADFFGAPDSSRIAFTLNVTQALNIALNGLLQPGDHVLTTSMEHNSVMRPLSALVEKGVQLEIVPLDKQGLIDPAEFTSRIRSNTKMAVVNHASNVTGAICPIARIKKAVGDIIVLVDAAQSAGAIPVKIEETGADIIAFTGHKGLLGPTGTGGLWIRTGLDLAPLVRGGTGSRSELEHHPDFMPDLLEAGTPNTHGLAGLAAGLEFIMETGLNRIRMHEEKLTGFFLSGLETIRGMEIHGPKNPDQRTAVVSVNLANWSPSDLARELDRRYGIMTRPGLHCAPRAHKTIGTFPRGTVRFSFGWFNTEEEIGLIIKALEELSLGG